MDIMIRRIVESDVDSIAKSLHIGINSASNTSATGGKTKKASGSLWWLCQVNKWSVTPNVIWQPEYEPFREAGIPEVNDMNVIAEFQKQGIGTALIREAERTAIEHGKNIMGIGFGLTADYGAAQRLYPSWATFRMVEAHSLLLGVMCFF
jgi:GNAT superfamily N-acetyltransferase